MKLKGFIEFLNETNVMKAAQDEKQADRFVNVKIDSFVKNKDKERVAKVPSKDTENKPILNTNQQQDPATPSW